MAITIGIKAIIGAGLFTTPAALQITAGPAGIITYALVSIAALFMALAIARVAQLYPEKGAFYSYAKAWGGQAWGIIATLSYMIGLVIALGLLAFITGNYLHRYIPDIDAVSLSMMLILLVVSAHLTGAEIAKTGQKILLILTYIPIVLVTVLCLFKTDFNNLTPFFPYGWTSIFTAVPVVIFGFFGFEDAYLHSDPNIAALLFIGGTWRKFSIFNDPVIFAYTMVVASCLCIGLLTGPVSKRTKWLLCFLIFMYVFSMLYSGTRGAFVLIPAALILFSILRFNKTILAIAVAGGVAFLVLINISTSNNTLYRFQTAFKPSKDLSYLVRKANQKRIQPYILSHPLGGGLGSTGEWGLRFSPNSYLAHFPPDSGYVRVAVECGWLGLFIFCTLMFTILKTGIENYYAIKDPELKSYSLAMLLIVCAFNIGNFPQEALVQFPSNVFFYLVAALIVILRRLDEQKTLLANGTK